MTLNSEKKKTVDPYQMVTLSGAVTVIFLLPFSMEAELQIREGIGDNSKIIFLIFQQKHML